MDQNTDRDAIPDNTPLYACEVCREERPIAEMNTLVVEYGLRAAGRPVGHVCEECLDNGAARICGICACLMAHNDYRVQAYTSEGLLDVCRVCQDYNTFECIGCGDVYGNTYADSVVATDEGGNTYLYCEGCSEDCVEWCDDCDEYHVEGNNCGSNVIHNYSYKPDPIFHPDLSSYWVHNRDYRDASKGTLYAAYDNRQRIARAPLAQFGVELEVDVQRPASRAELARFVVDELDSDTAYLKEDGSIPHGFEIVTHPRSLDSWRKFAASELAGVLDNLADRGGRSWDQPSCGLHVHVSRVAFDGPSHVARFALLFTRNADEWRRLARRSTSYANFDMNGTETIAKALRPGYASHFDAVNLTHADTIEIRIFKPSLRWERVLGAVEIVASAMEYTRTMSSRDVAAGGLMFDNYAAFVRGTSADRLQLQDPAYPVAVRFINRDNFRPAANGRA